MISIDQWDDLVFPDNVSLQRTVNDVLENFRKAKEAISKIQIKDEISNSSTKLFDEFDTETLNNALNDRSNKFNGLIEKKANESLKMSMYINDLSEYFRVISQTNTSVDVILETLSTSLNLAKERKSIAEKLKDGFNQFIIPGLNYFGVAIAGPPINNKKSKGSRRKANSFNNRRNIILLLCALSIFAIAYIFPIYIDNAISKFGEFVSTPPIENEGSGDKPDKSGIPQDKTENYTKSWTDTLLDSFTETKGWFDISFSKSEGNTTRIENENRANTKNETGTPIDDAESAKAENSTKEKEKETPPDGAKQTETKGHYNNTSQVNNVDYSTNFIIIITGVVVVTGLLMKVNEDTTDQSTEEIENLLRCNEIINNKLPAIATNADILYQFWEQIIPILESHIEALESENGQTDIKLPQLYVRIKEKWLEEENNCKSSYYALKNSVAKNGLMFNETNNSN